jgi:hypothetical protein
MVHRIEGAGYGESEEVVVLEQAKEEPKVVDLAALESA